MSSKPITTIICLSCLSFLLPCLASMTPSSAVVLAERLQVKPPLTRSFIFNNVDKVSFSNGNRRFAKSNALRVRGGGMPEVSSSGITNAIAKAATICTGIAAAFTYIAPTTATQSLYGLPNSAPLIVWLVRALGGSLAMLAIQAYCVLFRGMDYTKAIGFGCLPFMINEIRTLVLNETKQWNMPPWALLFVSLPISSSCVYILISEKFSFSKKVAKAFALWTLFGVGLPLGFATKVAAKGWGIDPEEEGVVESLKLFGFADIASVAFMLLLDKNVDSTLAFVCSFVLLAMLMLKENLPRVIGK